MLLRTHVNARCRQRGRRSSGSGGKRLRRHARKLSTCGMYCSSKARSGRWRGCLHFDVQEAGRVLQVWRTKVVAGGLEHVPACCFGCDKCILSVRDVCVEVHGWHVGMRRTRASRVWAPRLWVQFFAVAHTLLRARQGGVHLHLVYTNAVRRIRRGGGIGELPHRILVNRTLSV